MSEPGALPLLQYALMELFEQRKGRTLTREAYQAIGQSTGALARRAEELYAGLTDLGNEAARQMFLRLVTLGEGVEDTRRRVPHSELLAIDLTPANSRAGYVVLEPVQPTIAADAEDMDEIIDMFAAYRLLTLDNDPAAHMPTVEVAHESLLYEWARLRHWLNDRHDDIKMQRRMASMAAEWRGAHQDSSYLTSVMDK
jgi:hypothetical protein